LRSEEQIQGKRLGEFKKSRSDENHSVGVTAK
jgi:hypothetical protein